MKTPVILACALALAPGAFSGRGAETVPVSSLQFTNYKPWITKPGVDKSVDGRELTMHGHKFERGFGMRARQQLLLQLDGGATRLSAMVGVDDEAGARGGVVEFRVLGDGRKKLWSSGPLEQGQDPKSVDLDVTGIKLLTLLTLEAGGRSWAGHGDWAEPRLEITGAFPQILDPDAPAHAFELGPQVAIATNPVSGAPRIHAPLVVGVRPGTPFLFSIPAGGEPPLTYSAKRLPRGLELDAATGILRGSVKKSGEYPVPVMVRNRAGSDKGTLKIIVGDALALTPPMGWNSFDNFGGGVKESEVLDHARYMAARLKPFGWRYVVIDYIWFDPTAGGSPKTLAMDEFGRLQPVTNRYPSAIGGKGFKPLADQVHALGLSFGIHIMRGIPRQAVASNTPIHGSEFRAMAAANTNSRCNWNDDMYGVRGATPAGHAYYDSIFRLYAGWGVDFIKVDDISSPYHADEIEAIRSAIDKCGRSIVLSLSPGPAPLGQAPHLMGHANLWRETGDFWDNWDQLEHQFEKGVAWSPHVGAGHWPDADMLPVGHIGDQCVGLPRESNLNQAEQVSLLTLWALQSSPLMVGADLTKNDPWTLALLSNPEVLSVDQDSLGAGALRVSKNGAGEVWKKRLADGSLGVGLFNRGEEEALLGVTWSELQIAGDHSVRDLWRRQDAGSFDKAFQVKVPPHGAVLVRMEAQKR